MSFSFQCPHCSTEVEAEKEEWIGQTAECPSCRKQITIAQSMICSGCGEKISIDYKFCPKCGRQVTDESNMKYCPKCKNLLPNNAKYCPKCTSDLFQTGGTSSTLDNDSSKTTESESTVKEDLQVYCPHCKCTQISTIVEEHTDPLRCLLWGIFALGFKNKVLYNVCKKCGYKWELKQSLSKEEENQQNSTNATIFLVGIIIIAIIFVIVYQAYS